MLRRNMGMGIPPPNWLPGIEMLVTSLACMGAWGDTWEALVHA